MKSEARLVVMFGGWIMAFCGIRRRSWPGTMITMLGLALAQAAVVLGPADGHAAQAE
jgi:hypothetical protein